MQNMARLDRTILADVARAIYELSIARCRLGTWKAERTDTPPRQSAIQGHQERLVDRVSFIIPRVAARLPWRADCLVQALAAERWLERSGIAASLHFGARKEGGSGIKAHAWLTVDGRMVTGGNAVGYQPFLRQ